MKIEPRALPGTLSQALARPEDGIALYWLGQAGFLLRLGEAIVLIDPYLSDSLAAKYRGQRFGHQRMMPPPIAPEALARVDLVLCTHRHSDHMDPGTLPMLAERHPACCFVVPLPERRRAEALLGHPSWVLGAAAGEALHPLAGLTVVPVPSAHEALEVDAAGDHHFLGFGISWQSGSLYHSGDCIPYPGLVAHVQALGCELALLPVNGRDAARRQAGVPGNFTLAEAACLCREAGIASMIAHHWGLFDFNTCDPAEIDALAAATTTPAILRPDLTLAYRLG